MPLTLVQAASVCVALHILEGEKKIKKTKTKSPPNLYLDEEYTGGPKEK